MRNVLIIIGKLVVGGAEKVGRDIGLYADKDKYNISYLVFGEEEGSYEKELKDKGCKIFHFNPPSYNHVVFCMKLSALIKSEKIDIVHSHTMFNSGLVMLIARWNKVPIRITHSHSIKAPDHKGIVKNLYEMIMRKCIILNSTRLVACGRSAGIWLFGKKVFDDQGRLIYNGIDLHDYCFSMEKRALLREKLGVRNAFVIGHVGHMAPVKNQIFIMKLMPEIIKRLPNAVFLMIGDGNEKRTLINYAQELNIENKVILTGNVGNVGDYLSAMDVFVFPSLYEGMPLSLIEAQANGIPCIISNQIPEDVYLTDIIKPLSIKDNDNRWIEAITNIRRTDSENYQRLMYDLGFDIQVMLKKIYELYDGR